MPQKRVALKLAFYKLLATDVSKKIGVVSLTSVKSVSVYKPRFFFFVIHENLKSMLLFFKIFLNDNKNNTRIIN